MGASAMEVTQPVLEREGTEGGREHKHVCLRQRDAATLASFLSRSGLSLCCPLSHWKPLGRARGDALSQHRPFPFRPCPPPRHVAEQERAERGSEGT